VQADRIGECQSYHRGHRSTKEDAGPFTTYALIGAQHFTTCLLPTVDVSNASNLFGSLLGVDGALLAHGGENNDAYNRLVLHWVGGTPIDLLVSLPSSVKSLLILSPTSPSGILTSSLVEPSSDMRERKPSSETSTWLHY
jgi:hypothetical protein